MSLVMPEEHKNEFEITPEGGFLCVCYRVVDLGTQKTEYMGETKFKRKFYLSWEIPNEKMADGRPFSIHKKYTLSSHEKSQLRKDLESWRGKKFTKEELGTFDIGNIIGKPCLIQVVHNVQNDNTYANISAIMSVPKGTPTPELHNETLYFSLNDFKQEVFDKLSENMRETIKQSPEYIDLQKKSAEVKEIEY